MMDELLFLKDNIFQSRQNDKSGKNVLKLVKIDKQNEFLFEKNLTRFIELIDFLEGKDDIFVITGYPLSGKSLLTSTIPQLVKEKTIFYPFKCTPASTLDDLLLGFFEVFKIYAQKKLVHIPKVDTQNFQERINFYLTKCENPIIILLDGLNEINEKKYKDEIMNFLSHITYESRIKLVITTRTFDISDFKNLNLKLDTTLIKPLTLDNLKDYFEKYSVNSEEIEEFYKISRGHYFNLSLSMSYIQPTNITVKEFLAEISSLGKNIDDVVISKNLKLIPQNYENLLWVLSSSDFGMPVPNVLALPDVSEDQLMFLNKKGIVEIINDSVYVKDYFKKEIIKTIEPLARINIIKGIIKFLEAQLPLKPVLRELKLSRNTIRNEIERLNNILNKSQQKKPDKSKTSTYMNILGYSRQYKTNWDGFDEIIMPDKEKIKVEEKTASEESKEIESEDFNEQPAPEKNEESATEELSSLNFAKLLKSKYDFSEALIHYGEALSEAEQNKNYKLIIEILKDIAECYFKLGDYKNSTSNYIKAHDIAEKENLKEEKYAILFEIAQLYKTNYKNELAEDIYREIIKQSNIDNSIKLKAEINLFEMNFSNLKPHEIINKYILFLKKAVQDKPLTAKIYFRLGFIYDKASSFENAVKYYNLSIKTCDDYKINENISSCYYNLAEIYSVKKDYEKALDNYLKSYSVDEVMKNIEGLLTTTRKIAKIYEKFKNESAVKYYEKAIEIAKMLNDNYPIACAIIDLGDYYYRQKKDIKALKVYISAKKILANQLTYENERAINDRINDLKVRLGKSTVDSIIREFS